MAARVAIVGGGITGLATAFYLEKYSTADIVLIEASDRLGGKVRTDWVGDLLVEAGPDCFFTHKPWAMDLVKELSMEFELIEPDSRDFSMLIGGRLERIPRGLASLGSVDPDSVRAATFMSRSGIEAALNEPNVPPGDGADESISGFFRRRFGAEFAELIATPLLAGTHAGDAERLSMAALYPAYFKAERKFGTLTKSARLGESATPFVSLRGGMETLSSGVAKGLKRTETRVNSTVSGVSDRAVTLASGESLEADYIVLTVPSWAAAEIVECESLRKIRHASSAIVTLAYQVGSKSKFTGTGFLVPESESTLITGCTWTTNKWKGRAPDGIGMFRVFMGGDGRGDFDVQDDAELSAIAINAISLILDSEIETLPVKVERWREGLPQYDVGHLNLLAEIEREMANQPRVFLVGASYRGVGIPDCIRQGLCTARSIAERIA